MDARVERLRAMLKAKQDAEHNLAEKKTEKINAAFAAPDKIDDVAWETSYSVENKAWLADIRRNEQYIASLGEREKQCIKLYAGPGASINNSLRNSAKKDKEVMCSDIVANLGRDDFLSGYTKTMDAIFDGIPPLQTVMIVYRCIHGPRMRMCDMGYVSTSLNKRAASCFGKNRFKITLPIGTRALFMQILGVHAEQEVLLDRRGKFVEIGQEDEWNLLAYVTPVEDL